MYQLLFPLLALIVHTNARCPANFEEFNFACYFFGQSAVTNYNQAFYDCFNRGGYLLNINAEAENDYIVDKLKQQTNGMNGFWIGGIYNGQYWVWQKTSDWHGVVIQTYMDQNGFTDWGPNEPGAFIGQQTKMAIMRNLVLAPYKWYALTDWPVISRMSYICEAEYKFP